jgi:hypothetical protein
LAYTIDSTTGALTQLSNSPFAAGPGSQSVAVDPSGKFAYVANHDFSNVSAYTMRRPNRISWRRSKSLRIRDELAYKFYRFKWELKLPYSHQGDISGREGWRAWRC